MMNAPPVPLAKLSRPRAFGTLARERLFARLDEARARPMIWVNGPAGAGKSTLLASYADDRDAPCLWYQADEADADLSSFFYCLGQGAQRQLSARPALPLLTPDYLSDVPGFARRWFRMLFAQCDPYQLIVIDNFERASGLAQVLRVALEEVPAGMTLIVAGRIDPPVELARALAHGDIALLGFAQLRLDEAEAGALARARGIDAPEVAAALNRRCDGWAAGFVIALAGEGKALPASSATRLLHDYFASEIFDQLAAAQRELLLATASLPSFDARMASAVARCDASEVLEALYRRQCFLSASGPGGPYRYHDLFREFLLARLDALPRERADDLRYRCAMALADCGATDEAMPLLAGLGRVEELKQLALAHADDLSRTGRWQTLSRWLSLLPQEAIDEDGWLLYWRGVSLATAAPQDARAFRAGAPAFRGCTRQTRDPAQRIGCD